MDSVQVSLAISWLRCERGITMLRNVLRSIHVARLRGVLLFGLFVYLCSAEARQNGQGDETNSNGQSTGQQTDTGQLSAAASSAQEKHTLECSSVSVLVRDM